MAVLKMGTRGSKLALAQSAFVARLIEGSAADVHVESVVIKTAGDAVGAPSPEAARLLPQGAKGLWVAEIEDALRAGKIDFAVHSAKDLPATLGEKMTLAAIPARADARDVLLSRRGGSLADLPKGCRIGTSSLRRKCQIHAARPDADVISLRGNVDTRLRRLEAGDFEAIVAAAAGLTRLNIRVSSKDIIPVEDMCPAPGQGALAVETRVDRADVAKIVAAIDDPKTRACVELERAFMAEIGGGCGSPIGAYARHEDQGLMFDGFFAREGDKVGQRVSDICQNESARLEFARAMAVKIKK